MAKFFNFSPHFHGGEDLSTTAVIFKKQASLQSHKDLWGKALVLHTQKPKFKSQTHQSLNLVLSQFPYMCVCVCVCVLLHSHYIYILYIYYIYYI